MKNFHIPIFTIIILCLIAAILLTWTSAGAETNQYPLKGWAWSSTVGWVSFNSSDAGAGGGPYNVYLDRSGNFGGYAWSPNVGWISFAGGDVADCNGGVGTPAKVNLNTGAVSGWIRVLSGKGREDGWDGCVELAGVNHLTGNTSGAGGVTYNRSQGKFKGFAWGSNVVGWVDFSPNMPVSPVPVPTSAPGTPGNPPGGGVDTGVGIIDPTSLLTYLTLRAHRVGDEKNESGSLSVNIKSGQPTFISWNSNLPNSEYSKYTCLKSVNTTTGGPIPAWSGSSDFKVQPTSKSIGVLQKGTYILQMVCRLDGGTPSDDIVSDAVKIIVSPSTFEER